PAAPGRKAAPGEGLAGPEIRPPELRAARLAISVKAPDHGLVDDDVPFAITLRNVSDETIEDVRVEAAFDQEFGFPGSTETRVGRAPGSAPASRRSSS